MTGGAVIRPMAASSRRAEGLRLAWPLLAILGADVGVFVWMASHGLDFTDESYYLLSYLHWRELTATATFFGAYFEGPFRVLGQHVAWIRIFGMALLVFAGGFFTWRTLAFGADGERSGSSPAPLPLVICGAVSALFYYSYGTTLRVPSYNLLVLFCMLVASGLLLYLVEGRGTRRQKCAAALGYGLVLGACALGKATSAVAMVSCHATYFALYGRRRFTLELAALALIGAALNFLILQAMQPRWLDVLLAGVTLITTLDGRYAAFPLASLWADVLRGAARLLPALLVGAALFVIVVRRWGRANRAVLSWMVVLLVSGMMLTIQLQGYGKSWWALLAFGSALLWLSEWLCGAPAPLASEVRSGLGLSILLFALPVGFSIGTNGSLPAHTQMATIFGVAALMLPLRRLFALRLIHPVALSVALLALCLPTLVWQVRSLSDPSFTYRLRAGVMDQQSPVMLGTAGDTLWVDATTRDGIEALARSMRDAGYQAGEPILDVTGDGPGLVYALGGRPVGVAWLNGGYPGSERVAALVLNSVPVETLRQAWVLSADDNSRALRSWKSLLRERTGGAFHGPAGNVTYRPQLRWDSLSSQPVILSLWRPTTAPEPAPEKKAP